MQSITWLGDTYSQVETIDLPKTGGGTATFVDQTSIVTYYTGSGVPSSSLGNNGDIYLKTT